jgi:DNA-directed RNA polymerase specialized sigma24 family protein
LGDGLFLARAVNAYGPKASHLVVEILEQSMSEHHSVSKLIHELQQDPSEGARQLWERYIQRLVEVGHQRLGNRPRRAYDEEDVAISAFDAFIRGAKAGRFKRLENRDDLWQVLVMLVERKTIDVLRRELSAKRGGGAVRGDSAFENLDASFAFGIAAVEDPNPAVIDQFTIETRELLRLLDDEVLQKLAIRKLEGYTNQEIAQDLEISLRAVERKLKLIRSKWECY